MSLSSASPISRGARSLQSRLSFKRGDFSSPSCLAKANGFAKRALNPYAFSSLSLGVSSHARVCAALASSASPLRHAALGAVSSPFALRAKEARALTTRAAGAPHAAPDPATEDGVSPSGDSGASRGSPGSVSRADEEEGTVERRKRSNEEGKREQDEAERSEGAEGADEDAPAVEEKYRQCLEEVENLKKKNRELQDKALRAFADMENARMRHQKEMASLKEYAVSDFAKAMLDVADAMAYATNSLHEAVQSDSSLLAGQEANGAVDLVALKERLQQIYDGVKLTENLLHKTFDRFGVEQFDPAGEKFNPALHEALFELEHPNKAKGEVAQVIQKGYKIKDRVLRAAKVGVAKGAPNATSA
ncbi:grpe protein homolog, related [Neospora caninum Liverpool]|uniref:GrpE protein homolog, related n=1 Tax=Neospora caninum (strain Liverpool) TaxID=572307 RepID=F0VBE5_NEOCL|nr:grpe protein homolog, related [Neospora caninum Liverpool]CBZ50929.1 grpe protein homolog, related [Neospora caninum Liverpool]CEL68230.1 TPA: GrpE protein homolog, related [Neospora caninum Liverpool]|eukprot:XP_003880962.1 grpe protein homolog, related [Neospora caninum Liverpool]